MVRRENENVRKKDEVNVLVTYFDLSTKHMLVRLLCSVPIKSPPFIYGSERDLFGLFTTTVAIAITLSSFMEKYKWGGEGDSELPREKKKIKARTYNTTMQ